MKPLATRFLSAGCWLIMGMALVSALFAIPYFFPYTGPGNGTPGGRDDWDNFKLFAILLSPLVGKAAFGASIGTVLVMVGFWPAIGVFLSPVEIIIIACAAIMVSYHP